jgi:ribosome-binding protein aMBF1 (putative translation factor)
MEKCKNCGKELNESQYKIGSDGKDYKSCPSCSVSNGSEHIFYLYPLSFGTTPLRATTKHPDGPQSHCEPCRGGTPGPHLGYKKCSIV